MTKYIISSDFLSGQFPQNSDVNFILALLGLENDEYLLFPHK